MATAAQTWEWPDPAKYGDEWAHDYDQLDTTPPGVTEGTVDTLARLARGGPVLDVAAGTGRVAVPLAHAGIAVTATDASPRMLEQLRKNDPVGLVRTRIEVLPAVSGGPYAVISILANSIWVLRTAEEQQRFLANAAASLMPSGVVVVEMAIVDTTRWGKPRDIQLGDVPAHRTTVWDPDTRQLCHTFHLAPPAVPARRVVHLRYLSRDELFRMAAAVGLAPRHLWASWDGTPHGPDHAKLIAVLERADCDP